MPRGGRGYQQWNSQHLSRRDQWEGRRQNDNFVPYSRSRSSDRFSNSHSGQWKKVRRNHNQRGRRSSSCGPPRRFYNNQGPVQNFHRGPPPLELDQSSWQEFHRNHPPPYFSNDQGPQQKSFSRHNAPVRVSYNHQNFMGPSTSSNVPQKNDRHCNNQQKADDNRSLGGLLEREFTKENARFIFYPEEGEILASGMKDIDKNADQKLWVVDQKAFNFITANVPKDLQQQARVAFGVINDRVIKKIITFHCHYCSIRCRDLQSLENHKTTTRHARTRDLFLKNWMKGDAESSDLSKPEPNSGESKLV